MPPQFIPSLTQLSDQSLLDCVVAYARDAVFEALLDVDDEQTADEVLVLEQDVVVDVLEVLGEERVPSVDQGLVVGCHHVLGVEVHDFLEAEDDDIGGLVVVEV